MSRRGQAEAPPDVDPELVAMAQEEAAGLRFVPGRFEWVDLDDIEPHPRNSNEGDVGAIAEGVETIGFYGLLYVQDPNRSPNGKYRLCAGEHRWLTLRQLGATRAPCWVMDVDDDTAFRILVRDNHTVRLGRDRLDALAANLRELATSPLGLAGTAYDGDDLDMLLAELERDATTVWVEPTPPPSPPEIARVVVTTRGALWTVGPHRVLCGDSRDPDDVDRLLDGATINVAVTSPPYAEQREYDESSGFQPIAPDEYVEWFHDVQANVAAHLALDGSWFVNIKPAARDLDTELYVLDLVLAHVREWGWHFATEFCWERVGVPRSVHRRFKNQFEPVYQFTLGEWKMRPDAVRHWSDAVPQGLPDTSVENYPALQGSGRSAILPRKTGSTTASSAMQGTNWEPGEGIGEGLAYPGNRLPSFAGTHEALGHGAAFPVGLPAFFYKAYTDPGDHVYDPFLGSGSSLVAAHQTGRVGYGIELSPAYCDIALGRLQRATGIVPVLASTGVAHDFSSVPAET